MRRLAAALALTLLAAACGDRPGVASGSGSPVPVPTASPTGAPAASGTLTPAQLKYRLIDRFGRLWYCDPDLYPVARSDQDTLAEQRFPETQKDGATFSAILAHLGYAPSSTYTHAQKVAIYSDWKLLGALALDTAGAAYRFDARFTTDDRTGSQVAGTIDQSGSIAIASQRASGPPPCPICLARGTRIATPTGPVAVEDIREGLIVWTMDERGNRVAAAVERAGNMTAPADHKVVHLVLADGREVYASPGHPIADGRPLGSLVASDQVDGTSVLSADRVPYGFGTTFDLLPAGPTGVYWADGVPLQSTIRR